MQTDKLNSFFESFDENEMNSIYGGTFEQEEEDVIEIIYVNGQRIVIRRRKDGTYTILAGMSM